MGHARVDGQLWGFLWRRAERGHGGQPSLPGAAHVGEGGVWRLEREKVMGKMGEGGGRAWNVGLKQSFIALQTQKNERDSSI